MKGKKLIGLITLFSIIVVASCSKKTNPVSPTDSGSGGGSAVSLVGTWVYQLNPGDTVSIYDTGVYEAKTNNTWSEKGTWQDQNPYFVATKQYNWNGSWTAVSEETNMKTYYMINDSYLYFCTSEVELYKRITGSGSIAGEWELYGKTWTSSTSNETIIKCNFDSTSNLVVSVYSNGILTSKSTNVYDYANNLLKKGFFIVGIGTVWYATNSAYIVNDTWLVIGPHNSGSAYPLTKLGWQKQ